MLKGGSATYLAPVCGRLEMHRLAPTPLLPSAYATLVPGMHADMR